MQGLLQNKGIKIPDLNNYRLSILQYPVNFLSVINDRKNLHFTRFCVIHQSSVLQHPVKKAYYIRWSADESPSAVAVIKNHYTTDDIFLWVSSVTDTVIYFDYSERIAGWKCYQNLQRTSEFYPSPLELCCSTKHFFSVPLTFLGYNFVSWERFELIKFVAFFSSTSLFIFT